MNTTDYTDQYLACVDKKKKKKDFFNNNNKKRGKKATNDLYDSILLYVVVPTNTFKFRSRSRAYCQPVSRDFEIISQGNTLVQRATYPAKQISFF